MRIIFEAPDYTQNTDFQTAGYRFEGSTERGWTLQRDGALYLELVTWCSWQV